MTAYLWGHVDALAVNVFLLAAALCVFVYACAHVIDREYRIYRRRMRRPETLDFTGLDWHINDVREPPCGDPRPDPRTHPEYWTE